MFPWNNVSDEILTLFPEARGWQWSVVRGKLCLSEMKESFQILRTTWISDHSQINNGPFTPVCKLPGMLWMLLTQLTGFKDHLCFWVSLIFISWILVFKPVFDIEQEQRRTVAYLVVFVLFVSPWKCLFWICLFWLWLLFFSVTG